MSAWEARPGVCEFVCVECQSPLLVVVEHSQDMGNVCCWWAGAASEEREPEAWAHGLGSQDSTQAVG